MTVTQDRPAGHGTDPGDARRNAGAYTSGANALAMDPVDDWEPVAPRQSARPFGPRRGTVPTARTPGRAGLPERLLTQTERPQRSPAAPRPHPRAPWVRDVTETAPARPPRVRDQQHPHDQQQVREPQQLREPQPARQPRRVRAPQAAPLPVSWPRTPFLALVVGIVVLGVVGVLVLNTKINEGSFRLGDLRANQAALDLQEAQLNQQLADLESPGNLRAAATRLGLVAAGTPAFITLPDGRVVGIPQPASGR